MKKYIAVMCVALFMVGCGGNSDSDDVTVTTETEITTEEKAESEENGEDREEREEREEREDETLNQQEDTDDGDEADVNSESENTENTDNSNAIEEADVSFENSDAYKELESLASNAGFEISLSGNNVVFRTYITDDTVDYINEKNEDYYSKWDENCGLYEEFCSEAVRIIKNNNVENINAVVEVAGRSDNKVYFRNENGISIYNAYDE